MFALLAAACGLPAPAAEPEKVALDPGVKEALIETLDLLRTLVSMADLDSNNLENEEREQKAFISTLDKLRAAAENDDWDFDFEDGEETALLVVLNFLENFESIMEVFSGQEMPRVARRVRNTLTAVPY